METRDQLVKNQSYLHSIASWIKSQYQDFIMAPDSLANWTDIDMSVI